jgi:ketosteroid isomerase-like protein
MNRLSITAAALLGVMLALGACQPRAAAPVADTAADEAAVRKVLSDITTSFNAGDFDAMFASYRDDVLVSPPNRPDIVGKQAWREGMQNSLPPNVTFNLRFDTQELEIAGDLAYERGTFHMEMTDKATGAAGPVMDGRHIHIFKREADGSWKGWRLMENSAEAAVATPASQ